VDHVAEAKRYRDEAKADAMSNDEIRAHYRNIASAYYALADSEEIMADSNFKLWQARAQVGALERIRPPLWVSQNFARKRSGIRSPHRAVGPISEAASSSADFRFAPESDRIAAQQRSDAMGQRTKPLAR
jgi:hypothetical protein